MGSPRADRVLLGGRVHTVDPENRVVEAVALAGDRILATGSSRDMLALADERGMRLDLKERALLPGFFDAHVHLGICAQTLGWMVACHTPPCRNVEDILARLDDRRARTPRGEWVLGQGNMFQEHRLADRRLVTREELDRVSRDHPIAVRFGAHITVLNSAALALVGVSSATPNPPHGTIDRDENGEPTGLLREMYRLLPMPKPSYEVLKDGHLQVIRRELLAHGVTSICEMSDNPQSVRILQELTRDGASPLRVSFYLRVVGVAGVERLLQTGFVSGFGNDRLRYAGAKMYADGGISGREAALHEPYADRPGHRGTLNYGHAELTRMIELVHEQGSQIAIHAVGDRAQDAALNAFADVLRANPRADHRHRIEHLGNLFGTPERLDRAAELGLHPVANPGFINAMGDFTPLSLGPERATHLYNLADMRRRGFPISGTSDCAGAHPETLHPMRNIWCAVERQTYFGKRLSPDQALTVPEAIRMATMDAAYAAFEEGSRGSLEPGKLADLVVLAEDPLEVSPEGLAEIPVDMTWIGGELVYSRREPELSAGSASG